MNKKISISGGVVLATATGIFFFCQLVNINGYDYGAYCKNIKKKLIEVGNNKNYYVLYSFYNAPIDSIWNDDLRAH